MKDPRYVISALSSGGVHITDYTDPTKPVTVATTKFGFTDNDSDSTYLSDDEKILVVGNGLRGVVIADIGDMQNI